MSPTTRFADSRVARPRRGVRLLRRCGRDFGLLRGRLRRRLGRPESGAGGAAASNTSRARRSGRPLLEAYTQFRADSQRQLKQARHDAATKQQTLESEIVPRLRTAQVEYARQRVARVRAASVSLLSDATALPLGSLSVPELKWLVVHACQVAGEMVGTTNVVATAATKTCAPLRWAGLDAGIVWRKAEVVDASDDPQQAARLVAHRVVRAGGETQSDDDNELRTLAQLFYHNSQENNARRAIWKESDLPAAPVRNAKKGRRLMRVVAAEDDYDEYPDDYDDYMYEDEEYGYHDEEDGDESEREESVHSNKANGGDDGDDDEPQDEAMRNAFLSELRQRSFMAVRASFLTHAEKVLESMDQREAEAAEGVDENHSDEGEEKKSRHHRTRRRRTQHNSRSIPWLTKWCEGRWTNERPTFIEAWITLCPLGFSWKLWRNSLAATRKR